MKPLVKKISSFARDEGGVQVLEYALIIAVVAISLLLGLQGVTNGRLSGFLVRVGDCLTSTCT
jgi:pilus assembly protein Flp/PilA